MVREFPDSYTKNDLLSFVSRIEDMEKEIGEKIIKDYDFYESRHGITYEGEIEFDVSRINKLIAEDKMRIMPDGRIEFKNSEHNWLTISDL